MNLRSIFISNGVGIFILMMLQYVSKTKILRHRTEDRIFSALVIGVMFGCYFEAFSYYLDGRLFPGSIVLNHLCNTYLFSFNLLLPFLVLVYVDLGLYGDIRRIRTHYRPQIIVGVLMLTMTFINLFVPIVYTISSRNVYQRLPFGNVFFLVILYYLLTAVYVTRQYEKKYEARAFININMFLIPIVVGTALQFMFYGLSVAWLASAIGLTGLHMMQQNETAYVDPLVETYNRQYLNHILSAWISRGIRFTGAMIDIDRFKSINDRFGHSEGDHALQTVASILKESCLNGEWVFRFAGDEFIVLKQSSSRDDLEPYFAEVEKRLSRYNQSDPAYPLTLSYGSSYFDSGDIDSFMKEIDNRMYQVKAVHHLEEQQKSA